MYREAHQDLIRDMSQDFTQFTDQEKVTEYTSDSGMEDGAISPVSSVGSENGIYRSQSPQSASDTSQPILPVKPQILTPSESSAFSKINKWTPTYPATFGNFPSMCPSSGIGYMPGLFVSPWIAESFQRSYPLPPAPLLYGSPDASPRKSSDEMLRSPPLVTTDNTFQSLEKRAFYHVDPRIPFTNYFMNLTKLLQKSEDAGKTQEGREATSKDEKPVVTEKHECFRYEDSEGVKRSPSPQSSKSAFEVSKDEIKDSQTNPEIPSIHSIDSLRSMNANDTNKTTLPVPAGVFPVPGTIDHLGSYPSLAPSTSMLPLVGGMGLTPTPGMFHPAFLQMAGIGGKRMHHPDKPTPVKKYKCDVCGKAFSRSNTLVTHKRIHTGDKPFKCEVCGRAFRQPGNLTRHRLTHTTVKPYVCPQCNKAFNRASNLHTHMRTHTNFKPFVCPYCGKGFHQKIDMKIHCYTHTGQRPHRCDVCGKGFTLSSTLNTHRRIHFDARSFPAPSFSATATVVNS